MTYQPYHIDGADRAGHWLITCDHATNIVPETIAGGDLGLDPAEMARHIAYDIGALGVARALGKALNSTVISSNFSRLVIDPNRGTDDPTLLMKLYDGISSLPTATQMQPNVSHARHSVIAPITKPTPALLRGQTRPSYRSTALRPNSTTAPHALGRSAFSMQTTGVWPIRCWHACAPNLT